MALKSKKPEKRKFIGYQIVSIDGKHNIPDEFYSFVVIRTKKVLDDFFRKDKSGLWVIVPVYSGEIEEPTFL